MLDMTRFTGYKVGASKRTMQDDADSRNKKNAKEHDVVIASSTSDTTPLAY
jgi:hypothetical protein